MSKYKRLTNKNWKENYDIFEDACCDTCAEDCGECERNFNALVRLAELEDKIENGQLLELPCKVGDTVYKVYGKCDGNSCPYSVNFSYVMLNEIGKNIFVTKEAAEAKLKELTEVK